MNPLQLIQAYCNDEKRAWKETFPLSETPAAEEDCCTEEESLENLSAEQIPCS